MKDKVSFVSTVRNEQERIRSFLDSLLNQSKTPDEIIIKDDSSTDETPEIVAEYIKGGANILLIRSKDEPNTGLSRNRVIKHSKHDIIAMADGDDMLHPDWLKNLVLGLDEADVVVGVPYPTGKTLLEKCIGFLGLPKPKDKPYTGFGGCIAMKRKVWETVGGYPEIPIGEDVGFAEKVYAHGFKVRQVTDAIVYYSSPTSFRGLFKRASKNSQADIFNKRWFKTRSSWRRWFIFTITLFFSLTQLWLPLFVMFLLISAILLLVGFRGAKKVGDWKAVILIPIVAVINELGYLYGDVYGLIKVLISEGS